MLGEGLQQSSDFLLDTGIIMRHLRNDNRAHDLLDYLEKAGEVSVSAITCMEILVGCLPDEVEAITLFFDRVPPVNVSREVAEKAVALIRKYPATFGKDNPRMFPDAIIAATAWQQGSTLITLDVRHFARAAIGEVAIQAISQNAPDWVSRLRS